MSRSMETFEKFVIQSKCIASAPRWNAVKVRWGGVEQLQERQRQDDVVSRAEVSLADRQRKVPKKC